MLLRPMSVADVDAVHAWARRPEVCRYQAWGPNTFDETQAFMRDAVEAWQRRPQERFAHVVELDGQVVGMAELHCHSGHLGEIAYVIHPDFWGRGLATAAGQDLLRFAFEELGLHRVFATCDPRNLPSRRVLQRLAMTYEGRLRETILIRDGWRDSDVFSILEHEYRRL
jgi:ribosomal-protein-alanine N-acetyltransferase